MPSDPLRLLVITYHYPPDGSVGGLRWAGITKYLTRMGWEVAVVTAAPASVVAVGTDAAGRARVERCPRLPTLLDRYRLARQLVRRSRGALSDASDSVRSSGPSGLLRRWRAEAAAFLAFPDESRGWVVRAVLRTRWLLRRFGPHVVVSSGPPHSAHLVARIATIGSAVPWFIDLRDPWAGPVMKAWESHPMVRPWLFRALFPRLERLAVEAAQGVIVNTPALSEALAARYPEVAVACVLNGVDRESLPPASPDPYPGLGIAYAGTLYGSRDLAPVAQALRIFLNHHPEAARAGSKLRVAGHADAPHARAFTEEVASLALEQHVEELGLLPRAQALNLVARSRLVVVLAQEQELQIPAKLYESVEMGIPTLVVARGDSAAGVEGKRLGAVVREPDDVEGIAGVLEQLWGNDSQPRLRCPVPISYEAIAPLVDTLFRSSGVAAQPWEGRDPPTAGTAGALGQLVRATDELA